MGSAPFRSMGSETTNRYQCTACGNENYTIIRADATNPRCKCSGCGFVYNGSDSLAAQEAGAIGNSSAETLAAAGEPERETVDGQASIKLDSPAYPTTSINRSIPPSNPVHIPSRPKYVFVGARGSQAPNGTGVEFCSAKDVKRIALKWHGIPHKVYELTAKSFDVKVEIS